MSESATAESNQGGERKLPPMLEEYLAYKKRYPDALLLFQVGDFYELFFEDAVAVSRALNLTLTSRDKNSSNPIPMCGVPIAVVDGYVERLVDLGHSVALVRQAEPAHLARGRVRRELDRIITPGTRLLVGAEAVAGDGPVAALAVGVDGEVALAFAEVDRCLIRVREGLTFDDMQSEFQRIMPAEVIVPDSVQGRRSDRRASWLRDVIRYAGTSVVKTRSDGLMGSAARADSRDLAALGGYAALGVAAKRAVRLLVNYLDEVTVAAMLPFRSIERESYSGIAFVDAAARKSLELVANTRDGGRDGTLFEFMDCTCTPGGARLLRRWILHPLYDFDLICARHSVVGCLHAAVGPRERLRHLLCGLTDVARVAGRLDLCVATPRDLAALREVLLRSPRIAAEVEALQGEAEVLPAMLADMQQSLKKRQQVLIVLEERLAENPPAVMGEAGSIRSGFSSELDRLRQLKKDGKGWLADLEVKERESSGITSLKLKYNGILGYFFEVTKANLHRVPQHFVNRQATVNGGRFVTEELKRREEEVLGAQGKELELERRLFEELRRELLPHAEEMRRLAEVLAELDVLLGFAELAEREEFSRPVMEMSRTLDIVKGRHPVVAKQLQSNFIANSLVLPDEGPCCAIITGPNMGGKSTFLRQAALIVIMAQAGSFVPAEQSRIGVVDKIFARIGASDDLAEGSSTFMVEMREAAAIISSAGERSLVLIDEIGRGTATSDGLALARAILEWIATRIRCRTLFATHFHDLTQLETVHDGIVNLSVGSLEIDDNVVFTHEIQKGPARKSYGIEVAKLAGLPVQLIRRADRLLAELDREKVDSRDGSSSQLKMFADGAQRIVHSDPYPEEQRSPHESMNAELVAELCAFKPDETTPMEALLILHKLHRKAGKQAQ